MIGSDRKRPTGANRYILFGEEYGIGKLDFRYCDLPAPLFIAT